MFDIRQFRLDGEAFMDRLLVELNRLNLSVTMPVDHLCFRVETNDQYESYKLSLSDHGQLLSEAIVNGRPIATYRLNEPFQTQGRVIGLVELPFPKSGVHYPQGFEHAEFVLNQSFELFSEAHRHLDFTMSGHASLNSELCLKLHNIGQVKFHYLPLDRVIEIEKSKIKDVIFDFDGTLIQSRAEIYELNRIVLSEALQREVTAVEVQEKFYPEFSKLFGAFGVERLEQKIKATKRWSVESQKIHYQLFDGVTEMFARLRDQQFNLHLWTARDERSARAIIESHKLERFFSSMSFGSPQNSKPHSESLKMDWRSFAPHTALVIGDSSSDILGAKNIGAIAAAALWDGHAHPSALIAAGAELFFKNLSEFEEWICREIK